MTRQLALSGIGVCTAGMAANSTVMQRVQRSGLGVLQPSIGLDALDTLLSRVSHPYFNIESLAVVPFHWGRMLKVHCGPWSGMKMTRILPWPGSCQEKNCYGVYCTYSLMPCQFCRVARVAFLWSMKNLRPTALLVC